MPSFPRRRESIFEDKQSPKNQSTEIHKRIPACAGMTAVMYPVFIVPFTIRPFSDDLL
ncbi:hypothetical protein [Neisseria sicca]|uniref:hypothetical protein n=1 Tax=Neisseria sicca TaxID=490 RepID=UPI00131BCB62|nr:hypothetical protein [Neisseria sicca]